MRLGWIGHDYRWWLPVHQPVESSDFLLMGKCGACENCTAEIAVAICGVCSYDPDSGLPTHPVPYPCPAVRETCRCNPAPTPRLPPEYDGKYEPRVARTRMPVTRKREGDNGEKSVSQSS